MAELVVDGPQDGRVLLGRLGLEDARRQPLPPLAAKPCHPVLALGSTRSGKTTSLLIPAVRKWRGPVIATSIRSDLLAGAQKHRRDAGSRVLIYNPTNQGDFGSHTWSPLTEIRGDAAWPRARRMAWSLVSAASMSNRRSGTDEDFWNTAAADYLGPLLLAAAADGTSMEPVMRWLQEGGRAPEQLPDGTKTEEGAETRAEIRRRLAGHPDALRAVEAVWGAHYKLRDSIYATARTALSAYQDDDVLASCLPTQGALTDITADAVYGRDGEKDWSPAGGATLFIVSPPTGWRYFAPLFTALVTSLIDEAYTRAGGQKLDPPLLLAGDEIGNIVPLDELPAWCTTSAGAGIQIITVLQDLGQAERLWGEADTRTVLSNHDVLLFSGTKDRQTLEWAQAMVGEAEYERWLESRGSQSGRGAAQHIERRPLMTVSELRQMPLGTALLMSGRSPSAIVALSQWTTI